MPSFLGLLRRTLSTMSQQGSYSVAFVTINKMEEAKKLAAYAKTSPPSLSPLFFFFYKYSIIYMNLFFVVDIFNIYFLENLISMEGILTFIIIVSYLHRLFEEIHVLIVQWISLKCTLCTVNNPYPRNYTRST